MARKKMWIKDLTAEDVVECVQQSFRPSEAMFGITEEELSRLSIFNSERNRGLLHSSDFKAQMRILQEKFDLWRFRER